MYRNQGLEICSHNKKKEGSRPENPLFVGRCYEVERARHHFGASRNVPGRRGHEARISSDSITPKVKRVRQRIFYPKVKNPCRTNAT